MIITKTALPRRTFLRGAGAAVALPLLDAMAPALSAMSRTAAAPVRRLAFTYIPNGAIMERWTPAAAGKAFDLPPILAPLDRHRDRLVVLSGLDSRPAEAAEGEGSGDHARAERGVADRRAPEAHRGGRRPRRQDHRSGGGRRPRPRHPAPVARARGRGLHSGGRLRHRLLVQLRQHAVVAHRDHPAAHADRPPGGLRAALRRGPRGRRAPAAARPGPQHPRRHRRRGRAPRRSGSARPTARASTSTSTTSARSSSGSGRWRRASASTSSCRPCPSGCPSSTTTT